MSKSAHPSQPKQPLDQYNDSRIHLALRALSRCVFVAMTVAMTVFQTVMEPSWPDCALTRPASMDPSSGLESSGNTLMDPVHRFEVGYGGQAVLSILPTPIFLEELLDDGKADTTSRVLVLLQRFLYSRVAF